MGTEIRRALDALDEAERLSRLERTTDVGKTYELRAVLNQIRLGYGAAASVSKLLRPICLNRKPSKLTPAHEQRVATAAGLELVCEMNADHPIHTRDVRDAFEHFDERLEQWLDDPENEYLHMEVVDHDWDLATPVEKRFPIVYHAESKTLSVLGDEFSLKSLKAALEDALQRSSMGMEKVRRLYWNQDAD